MTDRALNAPLRVISVRTMYSAAFICRTVWRPLAGALLFIVPLRCRGEITSAVLAWR
jgi:hypothetical protein